MGHMGRIKLGNISMSDLIIELKIDGKWHTCHGNSCATFLESAGYNPHSFRMDGHAIEDFKWIKTADGYRKAQEEPLKPKKRVSEKRLNKELEKLEKYLKQ